MAISTNQKPTIYRNLYENTGPDWQPVFHEAVSFSSLYKKIVILKHNQFDGWTNLYWCVCAVGVLRILSC